MKTEVKDRYEVVIAGGSYAGLAAAMSLGRALTHTLIIDSGNPCNQQTPHSHNFITQDGATPAEIAAAALEQVLNYPTVQLIRDRVTKVSGSNGRFTVVTASGQNVEADKILFATGIKDIMPDIPGVAECWGKSVIHCPYCHGYEYAHQRTAILMNGDAAVHMGKLISNWTKQLTICTNGPSALPPDVATKFKERGIAIIETGVAEVLHDNGRLKAIKFTNGTQQELDVAYIRPAFEQHSPVPEQLGCRLNEYGYLLTDDLRRTTVPGIYAAGDNSTMMRSVAGAVAAGTSAGAFIVHDRISEQF